MRRTRSSFTAILDFSHPGLNRPGTSVTVWAMLCRLALALVCGLALASSSLASAVRSPNSVPPSACSPCGPVWGSLGSGLVSSKAPWTKNRVYYARTPGQAAGWLPYVTQRDRRSLEHLNFSKSGVFAVFFKDPGTGPVTSLTLNSVDYVKHGLAAEIRANVCNDTIQLPGISPACVAYRDNPNPWGRYVLVTIRKRSLYEQIEGVYAYNVASPLDCSTEPPPSACVVIAPPAASLADDNPPPGQPSTIHVPARPRPDWKLVSGASTTKPRKTDRILYARTLKQALAWKPQLAKSAQTDRALHQDFSTYGLLAVFLTARNAFKIDGVFLDAADALDVQVSTPPPVDCSPVSTCPVALATPQYALISINKGSLPAPVKRLYITEVQ